MAVFFLPVKENIDRKLTMKDNGRFRRGMEMRSVLAMMLLASVQSALADTGPEPFPVLKTRIALVAVVELAPGGPLQPVPNKPCKPLRPDVSAQCVTINLDPPPYWLKVFNRAVIYGPADTPEQFSGATSSHYGMDKEYSGPFLAFFITDGEKYVFRRNARLPLLSKRDGSLFLPLWDRHAPFLPCKVTELREEFQPDDMRPHMRQVDLDFVSAKEHPALFRRSDTGYLPKYAIPIDKLKQYLAQHPPAENGWACPA